MITNALSIDVEEYYHATIYQEATGGTPLRRDSRVEAAINRILRLLSAHKVHATFFVLGEVAAQHPAMVKRMARLGHEIACHGQAHELVSSQDPARFRADVRQAKAVLESLIGDRVLGYRAPSFSIGPEQAWAYDILLEEGFEYDSSSYPILHDRYGQPDAPRFPYEIRRQRARRLIEFPIGTVRCFGVNLPIGGGGWFRLLPGACVRSGIRHVNRAERRPTMFFFHPWEIDPGIPKPPMAWHLRFRLFVGLSRSEARLRALVRDLPFATAREVLASVQLLPAPQSLPQRAVAA